MSETFRVGDIVECVDVGPSQNQRWGWQVQLLAPGGLYTVVGIDVAPCGTPAIFLREVETLNPKGWRASRFRLIHRPRAEFLTELCGAPVNLPRETEAA